MIDQFSSDLSSIYIECYLKFASLFLNTSISLADLGGILLPFCGEEGQKTMYSMKNRIFTSDLR